MLPPKSKSSSTDMAAKMVVVAIKERVAVVINTFFIFNIVFSKETLGSVIPGRPLFVSGQVLVPEKP